MVKTDFEIVSVEPAESSSSMPGTDWHCYIIQQGRNTIRGYRQGSFQAVTHAVETIVSRLNERRQGNRGRIHLDLSNRRNRGASPRDPGKLKPEHS